MLEIDVNNVAINVSFEQLLVSGFKEFTPTVVLLGISVCILKILKKILCKIQLASKFGHSHYTECHWLNHLPPCLCLLVSFLFCGDFRFIEKLQR